MENKTIIITGASSGVGRVMAERFAKNGYTVCAVARSADKLDALAQKYPQKIFTYTADVSKVAQVKSVFETILKEHPRIDVLVNNASIFNNCVFHEEALENVDSIIDTNLKGTLYCTRMVAPRMVEQKGGNIINISSVSGTHGIPGQGVYGASKHGVNGFSDVIGYELREHGVLVTSICPGGIDTPLWDAEKNPYPGEASDLIKPEEIAAQVEFILSQPSTTLYKKLVMFPVSEWH